jgi:Putative prokaryotic signal transducing protein
VSEKPLVCPGCGRTHSRDERFCSACGMLLVFMPGNERDTTERQRRARKVKPQYTEGPLVKVARASNQPEAELIEALLLEEGIPSMQRRSGGFDVPDFLAAGPRDILVPESGAQAAREALAAPET